ncbi:MAG: glycosyltransferase family 2 protein [Deltaproteobacteria bacterium]|nr:glycosyltransferase family 2 protein [Deltaproteobacteria bacterium]
MTTSPTVSVIIPLYNQQRYIGDALQSVVQQTFPDWECIIINDGSTDGSRDAALACMQRDSRIRLIDQPNRGLSAARNRGLAEARGRYIQFLDADDCIDKEKLRLQIQALAPAAMPALSYTDYYSTTDDLHSPHSFYLSPRFLTGSPLSELIVRWETQLSIPIHCFLFDSVFFTGHRIRFDEHLPNHEDWDCWMNIFSLKPAICYIDQKLAVYRIHSSSMARNRRQMADGFRMVLIRQRRKHMPSGAAWWLITLKMVMVKYGYHLHMAKNALLKKFGAS